MGRRYLTTNQRNTKMIDNDDHDYRHHQYHHEHGFTKHPKQIQTCRGEPPKPTPEPHHTTGRGETAHNHTTPHHTAGGGGKQPTTTPHHGGGGGIIGAGGAIAMPQSDTCHKDRGPTVNKAIIVSRHVGRRYLTTNQRNTKMIVIMMIMIIVIINIIMSMGLPNTPSRSKHAGGNHQSPHPNHTTPQGGGKQPTTTPHHTAGGGGKQPTTTPHHGGGGGNHWGGGGRGGAGRTEIIDPQTVLAQWGSYVESKGIGCGPQRRTRRWGGAFVSTLPLWFRANSGLFWGGPRRLRAATAHAVVLTLPLWFRANSVAFRRSRCGFARIPLRFDTPAVVSREFQPLLACSGPGGRINKNTGFRGGGVRV